MTSHPHLQLFAAPVRLCAAHVLAITLFVASAFAATFNYAQETIELPEYLPGLIAEYRDASGHLAKRVDGMPRIEWASSGSSQVGNSQVPDSRLTSGEPIEVHWSGALQVKTDGEYRLEIYAFGGCSVLLDGREILAFSSQAPRWHRSAALPLEFGNHPISIRYRAPESGGSFALFWQGPGFQLEPISERFLIHESRQHPHDLFERGRLLSRSLHCVGCHAPNPKEATGLSNNAAAAPSLAHTRDTLDVQWIRNWLMETGDHGQHSTNSQGYSAFRDDSLLRRMPYLGLSQDDAEAIALALNSASQSLSKLPAEKEDAKGSTSKSETSKSKSKQPERKEPSREVGKRLFASRGCSACHALEIEGIGVTDEDDESNWLPHRRLELLQRSAFSGGDLSRIGSKRTETYLFEWLTDPARMNSAHRMPKQDLTPLERRDLASFLSGLQVAPGSINTPLKQSDSISTKSADEKIARGKQLLRDHRCGACHEMPNTLKPLSSLTVSSSIPFANPNAQTQCLAAPNAERKLPGFQLTDAQRSALATYWQQSLRPLANAHGTELLVEQNCVACHARDSGTGLSARLGQVARAVPSLAAQLAALSPPSLTGVGDKLHDAALLQSIRQSGSPRRPWLEIQMPKFQLPAEQFQSIVDALVSQDRIPDRERNSPTVDDDLTTRLAAGRLVTSDGFGCQSCHQIGKQLPPTVALNARGTDLTLLGDRVRRSWFDRWVRNPVRIVPRMEMPAIQVAVQGVLGSDLDRQLDAVWTMLNTREFQPPSPAPVRIVRSHNLPDLTEPAHVLTDVLETPNRKYLRPLIVGLQNRQNILFDLESGSWTDWWLGDTARELTRGKSWYWEIGAPSLTDKQERLASLLIVDGNDRTWKPKALEQFAVEFDELVHSLSGIRFRGRMHFASGDTLRRTAPFSMEITPAKLGDSASGIEIRVQFLDLSVDDQLQIELPSSQLSLLQLVKPITMPIDDRSTVTYVADSSQRHTFTIRLATQWPVDSFPFDSTVSQPTAPQELKELAVVPGFRAFQLPLPRTEMPTAIAWRDHQMVIGSLKGRVLAAIDSDQDQFEDSWQVLSDDMPAPYGLAVRNGQIDVLAKYGLVRLTAPEKTDPSLREPLPYTMRMVADGWGYTADYHDWAVGLPQDQQGNYYVALPCQQDDRSPSAARLRGSVQKLVPQSPTSSDPREFRLEPVSAGHRFPMGLTFNAKNDLFATDNQGNYNPFNELNHVVAGRRYGFINKLDAKPGFAPDFDSPAVNLPHPWTRSVNGICCLLTPPNLVKERGNVFGPFEGHIIGCEYNGLSLIRMSLEQVQGEYQGAAYMFSRAPRDGEATFEGPVVCEVSPKGELVVGNIHDSGWGGGQNTGSIVKLIPSHPWPLGIREVTARPQGLHVEFTQAVDATLAEKPSSYSIRSYRRISTPAYGGDDQDDRTESIRAVQVNRLGTAVDLELEPLREGYVYELRISAIGKERASLFPNEAHYSMKHVPKD